MAMLMINGSATGAYSSSSIMFAPKRSLKPSQDAAAFCCFSMQDAAILHRAAATITIYTASLCRMLPFCIKLLLPPSLSAQLHYAGCCQSA